MSKMHNYGILDFETCNRILKNISREYSTMLGVLDNDVNITRSEDLVASRGTDYCENNSIEQTNNEQMEIETIEQNVLNVSKKRKINEKLILPNKKIKLQ